MSRYYAYRVIIIQSNQLNAFENLPTKKSLFDKLVLDTRKRIKIDFIKKAVKHIVYFINEISTSVFTFELAREDYIYLPTEGEKSIIKEGKYVYPSIYFILDVKNQIVLIQDKSSVFAHKETSANAITEFIEHVLRKQLILVRLEPIADANNIWSEIDEAKEIYELQLSMDPPNFFKSRFKTNIDIKEAHEETNFTSFVLNLKNKFGGLSVKREDFGDVLKTLSSGAGEFYLKLKNKAGKIVRIGNAQEIKSVELPENVSDIDKEELQGELDALDQLNNTKHK